MEKHSISRHFEKPDVLNNIPLEQCAVEFEYVTGKKAFRAPDGKAFRVEGVFTVEKDDSVDVMIRPSDSRQSFLSSEEGRQEYDRARQRVLSDLEYLKRDYYDRYLWSGRNDIDFAWNRFEEWFEENCNQNVDIEEEAWNKLSDRFESDDYLFTDFPESFLGKWIILGIDDFGKKQVTIRGQVGPRVNRDYGSASFEKIMELTPQEDFMKSSITAFSPIMRERSFATAWNQIEWRQGFVSLGYQTNPADTQILFVDHEEETEIEIPAVVEPGLFLPVPGGMIDSSTYMEQVLFWKDYTEEEKNAVMRSRRSKGQYAMFKDDPLLEFNFHPDPSIVEALGLKAIKQIIIPRKDENVEIVSASDYRAEQIRRAYFSANNSLIF